MFRNGMISVGNNAFFASSEIAPSTDGPSTRPATISPITAGWPSLFASMPNRRATTTTTAMAIRTLGSVSMVANATAGASMGPSPGRRSSRLSPHQPIG
jgi:hypothetical protein